MPKLSADAPSYTGPTPARKVSFIVKLLVALHVLVITIWAIPEPRKAIQEDRVTPAGTEWLCYWDAKYLRRLPPVRMYCLVTGFWQYWDMFAPDPSHEDQWCDAKIHFRDGSVGHYLYPRIYLLPVWQKFFDERYRKYFERVGDSDHPYLWPAFGMRIALLNDNAANPPVEVDIYRHSRLIAPPGRTQHDYHADLLFSYAVDQQELSRLRNVHP